MFPIWLAVRGGLARIAAHCSQVGKAGDAILWHGWTPHSQSVNMRDTPRLALVARWNDATPLIDERTAEKTFHV